MAVTTSSKHTPMLSEARQHEDSGPDTSEDHYAYRVWERTMTSSP